MKLRKLISQLVKEHLFEQVRKQFHMALPEDLLAIARMFDASGHKLYVVGGSVRDALMGKEPKDYDVATDAVPDKVQQILSADRSLKVLEVGKAFGVINVITPEKNEYEIATFRFDVGKGRRPDAVEFTSIEKDVLRRDLTINALFYDIDKGEIVDYVGGIEDINNNVVRAVGDPVERFDEDRLRILRALRFAGRLGSKLDASTSDAIKKDNSLMGVSPERIRDEFIKGIKSSKNNGEYFISLVSEYDMWSQVFPGLKVTLPKAYTKNPVVMIALLLSANEPMMLAKKLNSLKYLSSEASHISFLVQFRTLVPETAYKLKKLFTAQHVSEADLEEYALLAEVPDPKYVSAFLAYSPSVSSGDLIAQGITGQELGKEIQRRETELFKELVA